MAHDAEQPRGGDLPQDPTLEYRGPVKKATLRGVPALVLGGAGIVLSPIQVGAVLGIGAVVFGFVALSRIRKNPLQNGGKGFAIWGILLGIASIPLAITAALMTPCLCGGPAFNRSMCAANLRGIVQSMVVYASSNGDAFPVVPFAPYGAANGGAAAAKGGTDATAAMASMIAAGSPVSGSPLAGPWMLVMDGSVSSKQFICKSDAWAKGPAETVDASGNFYLQFQKDDQISYSFAYPYTPEGKVGDWWKWTTDESLPVGSDMAPAPGTGKPRRDLAVTGQGNTGNHDGTGQNVAFRDSHVEWKMGAAAGQGGDNIFTVSGNLKGGSPTGIAPKLGPITVGGTPGNYDTVMVPERDLDTGKLW